MNNLYVIYVLNNIIQDVNDTKFDLKLKLCKTR